MEKRRSLRPSIRFEVFKRDGFTCQYCGNQPPAVVLEVDHIIAVASGGTDDIENLLTACFGCNRGKGALALDALPADSRERIEEKREAAEQLREYNAYLEALREEEDDIITDLGLAWYNRFHPARERDKWTFGPSRVSTVRQFMRELPTVEIRDAIEMAIDRMQPAPRQDERAWKYFCGICWTKIRNRGGGR